MVGHQMAFRDLALLLHCKTPKHLAKMLSQLAIQNLPPAFRDENDMV
jgi:hypothetical protein